MSSLPEYPSIADLERAPWLQVFTEHPTEECFSHGRRLYELSHQFAEQGDHRTSQALEVLGHCGILRLSPRNTVSPFETLLAFSTYRRGGAEVIAREEVPLLVDVTPIIPDIECQARVADICWLRGNHFQSAIVAIEKYFESSKPQFLTDRWIAARDLVERALRLSTSLGKGAIQLQLEIIQYCEDLATRPPTSSRNLLLPAHMMELLLSVDAGNSELLQSVAEGLAEAILPLGGLNAETAEWYWRIASRLSRRLGDDDNAVDLAAKAARVWVTVSEQYLGSNPDYLTASFQLEKAHQALFRIGRLDEARALEPRLLDLQKRSIGQMKQTSHTVDFRNIISNIESGLDGKTAQEAIIFLVAGIQGLVRSSIAGLVAKERELDDVSVFVGPPEHVDSEGRPIAKVRAARSGTSEECDAIHESRVQSLALRYRSLIALGQIETARLWILRHYNLTLQEVEDLIRFSPFVPPDREQIFARGLLSGFRGDFLVANHLLVPQIESSIRYILNLQGIPTTRFDTSGIQEQMDLNRLLQMEEISNIFGDDLAFDLKGLLIDRFGANLRNRLSHGLIDQDGFQSDIAVYAWWTAARLCILPLIPPQPQSEPDIDH